jgi:hypothetical protein
MDQADADPATLDLPPPDLAPAPQDPSAAQLRAMLARLRPSPFTLGGGCRWIEGDPRDPDGGNPCGAKRERGRPYCRAHCLRAYAGLQEVSAATMRLAVAAHSAPAADPIREADPRRAEAGEPAWHER